MHRTLAIMAMALVAAFSPFAAPLAPAHTSMADSLMLIHPTARPNIPNRPTAAYVTISNNGPEPDWLIGVSAPDFEAAELHEVRMEGDVMKMSPVESIMLPAGETVELAPGGYHIMLFGAAKQFKPGDSFPMTLTFEKVGAVAVEVTVEKIDPSRMGDGKMNHMDHSGHMGQTGN